MLYINLIKMFVLKFIDIAVLSVRTLILITLFPTVLIACKKENNDPVIQKKDSNSFRLMTYNISQPVHHPDPASPHYWPTRKARVISLLKDSKIDILCAQEDNPVQIEAITSALSFSKYGVSKYTGINGD